VRTRRAAPVARAGSAAILAASLALVGLAAPPAPAARAADPTGGAATAGAATPAPDGGDARSSGTGAGLAGAPLVAVGVVAAIGAVTVLVTLGYVRLTGGPAART
jgi:hypothetical protein